jgi:hypothetical protein
VLHKDCIANDGVWRKATARSASQKGRQDVVSALVLISVLVPLRKALQIQA